MGRAVACLPGIAVRSIVAHAVLRNTNVGIALLPGGAIVVYRAFRTGWNAIVAYAAVCAWGRKATGIILAHAVLKKADMADYVVKIAIFPCACAIGIMSAFT